MIDLRSDTVTRPSPEMRRVIAEAEVGDAVLGDDPTVDALERRAAEMLGKERALYFPSGIMANQTALIVLAEPGTEAVIEADGHILSYEEGAAAAWAGVQLRAVPTDDGLLTAERAARYIRPESPYLPRTTLLCLENTHNHAGGRILPLEQMRAVAGLARDRGLAVHLDGARLPNAAAETGTSLAEWAGPVDTVMISLSKGLGAPVGSILAGPGDLMERAWRVRRRLGGGMRQAGLLAAAGLHALEHNLGRLREDHENARLLAEGIGRLDGVRCGRPDTNIVMIELPTSGDPEALLAWLESAGVRMTRFGPHRLRAVTHLDVDHAMCQRAVSAFRETYEKWIDA